MIWLDSYARVLTSCVRSRACRQLRWMNVVATVNEDKLLSQVDGAVWMESNESE